MRFNMVEYKTNLTSFKYKMLEGKNYYFVGVALMGEGTRKVARCVSTMVQKIIQNSLVQLMNEAIQVLLEASQRPCTKAPRNPAAGCRARQGANECLPARRHESHRFLRHLIKLLLRYIILPL